MSIIFAIDEVGTFSYLEPLFIKWIEENKQGWGVVVSDYIKRFPRYKVIADNLPAMSCGYAGNNISALVTSLGSISDETTYLCSHAYDKGLENIGIIDTYDKVWDREGYYTSRYFVIDEKQSNSVVDSAVVIGQPAWEAVPELPNYPENTVLFIGQPIFKYYGSNLGYDEKSSWQLLCDALAGLNYKISYALHPAQGDIYIDDDIAVYEDINKALADNKIIVSPFSSALFDAWLGGSRNVISLQPSISSKDDKCYLSREAIIPLATDKEDIKEYVSKPVISRAKNPFKGSLERLELELENLL